MKHQHSPFCRAGQGDAPLGRSRQTSAPADVVTGCLDARGRSIGLATRQAGLLAYGSWRTPDSLPALAVALCPRAWPITAAAPQRICTVFPVVPAPRGTCRRVWGAV